MHNLSKQTLIRAKRYGSLQYRDLLLRLNGAYDNKRSVSLCTTVKNRLSHLQQTLLKNIEDNREYPNLEIVLLNYNCSNPETENWVEKEIGSYIDSGKVNYYRYQDSNSFERSHAKNLAFRLAKGELLCNVDADNFVGRGFANFISAHLVDGQSYLAGPRDGRGLGGRIALHRKHFERTGGYDERILNWGGDDFEFSSRLDQLPLKCRPIYKPHHLRAIQHSDELRMTYSTEKDKWESAKKIQQIRELNLSRHQINPNGNTFGCGRVFHNFTEWLTLSPFS